MPLPYSPPAPRKPIFRITLLGLAGGGLLALFLLALAGAAMTIGEATQPAPKAWQEGRYIW